MEIELAEEQIRDTIFAVENGDISAQEGWDSLCLFQKKNRQNALNVKEVVE
jgi:hypothetical protein